MNETATDHPVLALRDVTKVYGAGGSGAKKALDGIDLEVLPGRSLGIVGESGAGKSTLLKLMLGLARPTTGSVEYRGGPLPRRRRTSREFRRSVQMVFQDPRSSLDGRMSVDAIIREPLESLAIDGDHRARVRELLQAVGLDDAMAGRHPGEFSGGQRQRIAIARALAAGPDVLVLDEPVSALDVSVRAQIIDLLEDLKVRLGTTYVIVSHDLSIVGRLCEHTLILRGGDIIEQGPTAHVLTRPQEAYTRKLLDAVPRLP